MRANSHSSSENVFAARLVSNQRQGRHGPGRSWCAHLGSVVFARRCDAAQLCVRAASVRINIPGRRALLLRVVGCSSGTANWRRRSGSTRCCLRHTGRGRVVLGLCARGLHVVSECGFGSRGPRLRARCHRLAMVGHDRSDNAEVLCAFAVKAQVS